MSTSVVEGALKSDASGREEAATIQNDRIGALVDSVVSTARHLSHEFRFGSGHIDHVVVNNRDGRDSIISEISKRILSAADEICIQTYILDLHSEAANELFNAIALRQCERPELKIFLVFNDPIGRELPKVVSELKRRGIHANVAAYDSRIGRQSLHSKEFIIDGTDAYLGGDNIDNPKEKDYMINIKGPIIGQLLEEFRSTWEKAFAHHYAYNSRSASLFSTTVIPQARATAHCSVDGPMTILSKPGVRWRGDYYGNDADRAILTAVRSAQHEVNIASPNVNDPVFVSELTRATERGVKVNILVPRDYELVGSLLDHSSNHELLGIHRSLIKNETGCLEIRWFSKDGTHLSANHSKYVSVDGIWAYCGSQNSDNQSWSFSQELGVGISGATSVKYLNRQIFGRDWTTSIPAEIGLLERLIPLRDPGADSLMDRLERFPGDISHALFTLIRG